MDYPTWQPEGGYASASVLVHYEYSLHTKRTGMIGLMLLLQKLEAMRLITKENAARLLAAEPCLR